MPLKDKAKTDYQRDYMRKIRSNTDGSNKGGSNKSIEQIKEVLGPVLCEDIEVAHQYFVNLVVNEDRTLDKRYERAYRYHTRKMSFR